MTKVMLIVGVLLIVVQEITLRSLCHSLGIGTDSSLGGKVFIHLGVCTAVTWFADFVSDSWGD